MQNKVNKKYAKATQKGSVLLEGLVAVAIFSFGILALIGLQANMLRNTTTSSLRSEASYIAQKRVGEMWSDPDNLGAYVESETDISNLLPGGRRTVTLINGTQYQVTVGWTLPGEASQDATEASCGMAVAHCFVTVANISGA